MINRREAILGTAAAIAIAPRLIAKPPTARLNANENPWGPSPLARKAMQRAIADGNRYASEDDVAALKRAIAAREGLTPDHVVLGAGSSEILFLAAAAFLRDGGSLLTADPTFHLIAACAERFGAPVVRVPLRDHAHDLDAMKQRIDATTRVVYVCNPNNPTATFLDAAAFTSEVSRRAIVFADEAYLEYVEPRHQRSLVSFVREGRDVIVSRTFSKIYGMAGLRIGYALARPDLAKKLAAQSFNWAGSVAVAGALASLDDTDFIAFARLETAQGREAIVKALDAAGIEHAPSTASFVWFRCDSTQRFLDRGVNIGRVREGGWARVTVGMPEDVQRFTAALVAPTRRAS